MPGDYVLYTVTGVRETYYAAVHWESGRAWTAPTKDGASRQAREAGLDHCTEKIISKDELLRELGIGGNRKMSFSPAAAKPSPSPVRPEPPPTSDSDTWFIPGPGVEGSPEDDLPTLPHLRARGKGKSVKGKNSSPFTAGQPIAAPSEPIVGLDDDVLIVPSATHAPAPPAPFCDQEARPPEED